MKLNYDKEMEKKSVHIIVPCLSMTFPENAICIIKGIDFLKEKGYKVELSYHLHESLISRGRCVIAHKFMNDNKLYDYLMCIDSDLLFEEDAIYKLIQHDKLVVGANYHHKIDTAERWAGIPKNGYEALAEATFLPTGFMLVKREAFSKLIEFKGKNKKFNLDYFNTGEFKEVWGYYIPYINDKKMYLSEDWAFTQRLHDAGIHTYMDNLIQLGHIGKKVF